MSDSDLKEIDEIEALMSEETEIKDFKEQMEKHNPADFEPVSVDFLKSKELKEYEAIYWVDEETNKGIKFTLKTRIPSDTETTFTAKCYIYVPGPNNEKIRDIDSFKLARYIYHFTVLKTEPEFDLNKLSKDNPALALRLILFVAQQYQDHLPPEIKDQKKR